MTGVEITSQAEDHLEDLDAQVRERILEKLAEAREWTDHRLDPLSGWPYYKLRAGGYRVIISWDRDADVLRVEAVGHRRNVYDRHLPPSSRLPGRFIGKWRQNGAPWRVSYARAPDLNFNGDDINSYPDYFTSL